MKTLLILYRIAVLTWRYRVRSHFTRHGGQR